MLTGKCLSEFNSWFYKGTHLGFSEIEIEYQFNADKIDIFDELPFSCQWGVLVDFFDSVDIDIDVFKIDRNIDYNEGKIGMYAAYVGDKEGDYKTRNEARNKAIKAANKIYNEKHFVFPHDLDKLQSK